MRNLTIIALLLVWALSTAVQAQVVGPKVGVIPGTNMTRDEFRARAQGQLAAIALNSLTYQIAKGAYAPDIYTLQASPAWNLRIDNMFTGRPIQGIYFEPAPDMMTSDPNVGLGGMDLTPNVPQMMPQKPGGPQKPDEKPNIVITKTGTNRVDPAEIRDYEPGDVYYYTKGDMLQLIIFAPDQTYFEWVDESPNANFRANLQLREGQPAENIYAAQVLYYVETLAAQHYNLVQFMADGSTIPGAAVASLPGSKKIELAGRMGITVVNPVTRQPETSAKECSPGLILEGAPLKICTTAGSPLGMVDMTFAREDVQRTAPLPKPKPAPKPKPGQRAPGGPRPGAPGGGRRS
ncbi:MAG: hypothetical protein M3R04_01125 [bacterium]|nr:hypothetical protein [bacterium]